MILNISRDAFFSSSTAGNTLIKDDRKSISTRCVKLSTQRQYNRSKSSSTIITSRQALRAENEP